MNIEQASNFLIGSLLVCIGLVIIVAAFTIVNNLLHKYWKPVNLIRFTANWYDAPPSRYITPEEAEKVAPTLDPVKKEPTIVIDKKEKSK